MKIKKSFSENLIFDISAAVLCCGFLVYYLYLSRIGIQSIDESFYLTIPYRLLHGDRLIVDEWHVSQLSSLLQILPLKVFIGITGGTEGVILFFRQIYSVIKAIFFVYIYYNFRKYKLWALAAASIYMSFDIFTYITLNYYNMAIMASFIVCFELLMNENPTKKRLVFTGVVFSCSVIAEPALSILYFLWTIFVLYIAAEKKKKKDFSFSYDICFDFNKWKYVTAGISVCLIIFAIGFISLTDFSAFLKNHPELFTDSEYDFDFSGGSVIFNPGKILISLESMGLWISLFCIVLLIFTIFTKNKKQADKTMLVIFDMLAFCVLSFSLWKKSKETAMADMMCLFPVPFIFLGLACYLLSDKKDKRIFSFWLYGVLFSVLVDISSEASITSGFSVSFPPSVIMIKNLYAEIYHKKKKPRKKTVRVLTYAASVLVVITCLLSVINYLYLRTDWNLVEDYYTDLDYYNTEADSHDPLDTKIDRGVHKGIYTTAYHAGIYNDITDDIDTILSSVDGNIYFDGVCSWYYLYAGRGIPTYSAYYVSEDAIDRNVRWWGLHEEKKPSAVFVSKVKCESYGLFEDEAKKRLDKMVALFGENVTEMKTGYLIIPDK